jgi:hypothetical protein
MLSASEFVWGVVIGVITAALLWLISRTFNKIVLPWYQALTYPGVDIEGRWVGIYPDVNPSTLDDPDYTIHIKQKGSVVHGRMIRHKNRDKSRGGKEFKFSGNFCDSDLVVTYKPKDKTRLGLGAYVMQLTGDGRQFKGKCLYIVTNHRVSEVAEFDVIWHRKNAD